MNDPFGMEYVKDGAGLGLVMGEVLLKKAVYLNGLINFYLFKLYLYSNMSSIFINTVFT